ncbi:MAG: N-acetylneuraminate synthase family protein [Deltaproteobacteria bacterium]|uniref:N-acetylneuraminate synthase family protein n=1 Tax=Candidatus Zymogenus saltonus TaxID=2844893 RepID=A0A9D8KI23_9DELT|nr:N-acetylneuraminate synthase family protein [Candidatus Zymogenus saltonus]
MNIIVIPAQLVSRRLPKKNMHPVNGKPMLHYTLEAAKKSKLAEKVIVSTESDEVIEYAKEMGVEGVKRGEDLLGDVPVVEVYRDVVRKVGADNIEYVVALQPDHPDRNVSVDQAIEKAVKESATDLITLGRGGVRNGSVRIMRRKELMGDGDLNAKIVALNDLCTNIHTLEDLRLAERRLIRGTKKIEIGDFILTEDGPAFIIAEAGANHDGEFEKAIMLIEQAAEAGADAIKFQSYKAEKLVSKYADRYWGGADKDGTQLSYYKKRDMLGPEDYKELFDYAKEKGIIAFTSAFDYDYVDYFAKIDIPAYKIASCDLPNSAFIRRIAEVGKPVILSTGASTMDEIERAVDTILGTGNDQLIVLQCTLKYPTMIEDANFLQIPLLKETFPDLFIGISDHTYPDENMAAPAAAVALGAKVVEKHYTYCRNQPANTHSFSVDPALLKKMVDNIRFVEKGLGSPEIRILEVEKAAREQARRSIVASVDIKKGNEITEEMLTFKRPGTGMPPDQMDTIIGKKAKVDIPEDTLIQIEMIAED